MQSASLPHCDSNTLTKAGKLRALQSDAGARRFQGIISMGHSRMDFHMFQSSSDISVTSLTKQYFLAWWCLPEVLCHWWVRRLFPHRFGRSLLVEFLRTWNRDGLTTYTSYVGLWASRFQRTHRPWSYYVRADATAYRVYRLVFSTQHLILFELFYRVLPFSGVLVVEIKLKDDNSGRIQWNYIYCI